MNINAIAAVSLNGVIGSQGQLPWSLPKDLAYFKKLTLGKTLVMGRKTFESIGRPLPRRKNWILSAQKEPIAALNEDCTVFSSLEGVLKTAQKLPEIWIIGGASLYEVTYPLWSTLYLTRVQAVIQGDVFFPKIDESLFEKEAVDVLGSDILEAQAWVYRRKLS